MKNTKKTILGILPLLFTLTTESALGQGVVFESSPYVRTSTTRGFQMNSGATIENDGALNLVVNPGFERLSYGWIATPGSSFTYETQSPRVAFGVRAGGFDPSSPGQILHSEPARFPYALSGKPGIGFCYFKTQAAAGTLKVRVFDHTTSTVLAVADIAPSTTFLKSEVLQFSFPPATQTPALPATATSVTTNLLSIQIIADSNTPVVYVDGCTISEPTPIQTSAFSASAIPDTTNAYDLGSPSAKWKDLWLSGNANIAGSLTLPSLGLGVVRSSGAGLLSSSLLLDSDISPSAAITRTKLASGGPNTVVVNDSGGEMTDLPVLPITMGGTGVDSIGGAGNILVSDGSEYISTPLNTSTVPESGNLYFTQGRARGALSATAPLSFNSTTGVFSIPQANSSQAGYLSAADHLAFSNKANPGNYITALTGEVTASGPGSAAATLSGSAVVGKTLSGFSAASGGNVTASDSIVGALGKLENRTSINDAKISGFPDPTTTNGDIIIRAGGVTTRLGIGAPDQVLTSYLGQPTWRNNPAGFTNPMTSTGDMIYSSDNSGTGARLPIGTDGQYLQVVSGLPSWVTLTAANQSLSNLTSPTAINQTLLPGVTNSIDLGSASNQWRSLYLGTGATFSFLGTGVVKSSSTGVLSSSTLVDADVSASAAIDRGKLASGSANHVLINNGSGVMSSEAQLATSRGGTGINSSATFPASGIVATVPSAGFVKSSGTALTSQASIGLTTDVTGVLPTANGGTGVNASGATDGQLLIGNGTGFSLGTLTGTTNQVSVTNGPGSVTLGLPQNIHTAATPTFGGLTIGSLTGPLKATSGVVSAGSINLATEVTGVLPVANGGTGLSTMGAANTILGVNAAGTGKEHKALSVGTTGTDFNIANAPNSVTINLPDASATNRGAMTTGAQTLVGVKTFERPALVGSVSSATGNIDALSTSASSYVSLTGAAPVLRGIADGASGRILVVHNGTSLPVPVLNESASVSSGNEILTGTSEDIEMEPESTLLLAYSPDLSVWVVVGGSGSGSARKMQGSQGSPVAVDNTGITLDGTSSDLDVYVVGDGGAVSITSISPGQKDGQILNIIGTSDANSVSLSSGSASLKALAREIGVNNILTLRWNGTVWVELNWSN